MNELKSFVVFILLLIILSSARLSAQEMEVLEQDSLLSQQVLNMSDTIDMRSVVNAVDTTDKPLQVAFKPNPTRAIIYSAVFPGLGQIYNRKYWKLPIVYGGFLGCAYAITWNSNQYNGYKDAYNDMTDGDPTTNSWEDYRPSYLNPDPSQWGTKVESDFTNALKNKRDNYRRYKELSYIVAVGMYALCMIDAYVDAQLFDFDISPDLSMRMEPVLFERTRTNSRSIGLQCSFNF